MFPHDCNTLMTIRPTPSRVRLLINKLYLQILRPQKTLYCWNLGVLNQIGHAWTLYPLSIQYKYIANINIYVYFIISIMQLLLYIHYYIVITHNEWEFKINFLIKIKVFWSMMWLSPILTCHDKNVHYRLPMIFFIF